MSFKTMLNREVDVYTLTTGADDEVGGQSAQTWTCIYRRVPCRFNALTTRDLVMAFDKKAVFGNEICYMEYRPNIKEGDRLCLPPRNRLFEIKLLIEWDEARNYLKLMVLEQR